MYALNSVAIRTMRSQVQLQGGHLPLDSEIRTLAFEKIKVFHLLEVIHWIAIFQSFIKIEESRLVSEEK